PYPQAYTAIKQGWVERLRIENIPNYDKVLPLFNKLKNRQPWDPGEGIHSVPAQMVSRGVAFNTKFIKGPRNSLDELWGSEFGERLSIYNNMSWMVGNGAFHTGQDPNNIGDLEKVWDALRAQRKNAGRYFNNLVEAAELFKTEVAWIAPL